MGFMISVKGGRAPVAVHETVEEAIHEAVRLQESMIGQSSFAREVRVLQEVMTIPPRHINSPINLSFVQIQNYDIKIKAGTILFLMQKGSAPYPIKSANHA